MLLFRFFRSTSKYANAVALASLLVWLVKVLWLDNVAPIFPKAYILGQVLETTLSQIVASYIFYLFFVHKQELDDRRVIAPYILKHATRVYGECVAQLNDISKAAGTDLEFDTVTQEEVQKAFSAISMKSNSPLELWPQQKYATWFEYFNYHQDRAQGSIGKLLRLGRFLTAELSERVSAVEDCAFFTIVPMVLATETQSVNETLSPWGRNFYNYLVVCRDVKASVEAHR